MITTRKLLSNFTAPVLMGIGIYFIWHLNIEIPKELQGWVMMTVFTPIINMLINSRNIIDSFKKIFCYYHTWKTNTTPDVIIWLDHFFRKNVIYAQESISEVAHNKNSFWWNSSKVSTLPQTREVPIGWCVIKYKNSYLGIHIPFPHGSINWGITNVRKDITVYSFTKINWAEFIHDIRNEYFSYITSKRMIVFNSSSRMGRWYSIALDIRPDIGPEYCFGNEAKLTCWNTILNFFTTETKERYLRLGQLYKTSFLIHGPPGTGKSELIYLISTYLWKSLKIPVYTLNPQGLDNESLYQMISSISCGIIVVNEFDMAVELSSSMKKKLNKKLNKKDIELEEVIEESKADADSITDTDSNSDNEEEKDHSRQIFPTLVGWHNVLDNAPGEVVFWFTTNNINRLRKINNGSLIRKGRIDHIYKFDQVTDDEIKKIVKKFSPDANLNNIPSGLTIAEVIANIKLNGKFIPEEIIAEREREEAEKEAEKAKKIAKAKRKIAKAKLKASNTICITTADACAGSEDKKSIVNPVKVESTKT